MCRDLAHGVVEGQAEDMGLEVDGVACAIAFGPTPVAVLRMKPEQADKIKLPASVDESISP
jgi:hypothetical protein